MIDLETSVADSPADKLYDHISGGISLIGSLIGSVYIIPYLPEKLNNSLRHLFFICILTFHAIKMTQNIITKYKTKADMSRKLYLSPDFHRFVAAFLFYQFGYVSTGYIAAYLLIMLQNALGFVADSLVKLQNGTASDVAQTIRSMASSQVFSLTIASIEILLVPRLLLLVVMHRNFSSMLTAAVYIGFVFMYNVVNDEGHAVVMNKINVFLREIAVNQKAPISTYLIRVSDLLEALPQLAEKLFSKDEIKVHLH